MKEALLYIKNKDKSVNCELCSHFCKINKNCTGICGVRRNIDGKLYALNYNRIIANNVDPIEKKPFFHFLPESKTYSIATIGCNFQCSNCQNWQISQIQRLEKLDNEFPGELMTSEQIIKEAIKSKSKSISYTYTEPTVFLESAYPIMKLAHKNNLKNVWISNGFMSRKCLDLIIPYLDAINVDLKFFSNDQYKKIAKASLDPVLENLIYLKKKKVFIEVTTLLIPGETNVKSQIQNIAKFIKENLGADTPWHISRFSPEISYQLLSRKQTSSEELQNAYIIGKKIGLNYVYLGNVAIDLRENTYCPECEALNIERQGYIITRSDKNGHCQNCNYYLNIINK
ncbi:MAG TPA: AmmeMemoRadiSam system radical SAM enzyme [bacterium]|jgi:pyruvate formate lyase activating enzyme|nr:AmmeMemoRadiSam system radical SAM enzyme [bacterium]HOG37860.1 AmmeMemoRadiSam system radical SAM enzyme [bacterium]HQI03077.1 AmmeMemoRadiSam system radical SAM enzyme [bacterium]